ncbi:MAG: type III pantothenate kinase [Colwellia sp.]|nr:type III pantothenate kinase [Colwellia sp.]
MIALIDIGNTRTKYCIVKSGKRTAQQVIANDCLCSELLAKHFNNVTKLVVASVGHHRLTDEISAWCFANKVVYQRVVSERIKNGVVSAYQEPSQLGIDRWLTLVAAAEIYPQKNVLIIDAGTATTFDLLASNGQHLGGWILAGVNLLVSSVLANTKRVDANDEEKVQIAFGQNTSENVHNAAWAATVASVNMAISQSAEQGIVIDEILLTGGNGKVLSSLISQKNTVIEDLVFIGLQAY